MTASLFFSDGVLIAQMRTIDIGADRGIECYDCEGEFDRDELISYKYEPEVLLCDSCNEERLIESGEA
jgi:hypothetical protein